MLAPSASTYAASVDTTVSSTLCRSIWGTRDWLTPSVSARSCWVTRRCLRTSASRQASTSVSRRVRWRSTSAVLKPSSPRTCSQERLSGPAAAASGPCHRMASLGSGDPPGHHRRTLTVASGPELEVGNAEVQVGAVDAAVDLEDLAHEVAARPGRRETRQQPRRPRDRRSGRAFNAYLANAVRMTG